MSIHTDMSLLYTQFHEILLSVMTRKIGLMDRCKTLYPPQLIVWGIVYMVHVHVENNLLGK